MPPTRCSRAWTSWPASREVAIDAEMTHVTADIIFRTIFSRSFEAEEAMLIYRAFNEFQEAAYAHGLARTAGLPNWVSYFQYRTSRRTAKEIRAVLDPIVKARFDSFHAASRRPTTISCSRWCR